MLAAIRASSAVPLRRRCIGAPKCRALASPRLDAASVEMATVLDPYEPSHGWLKGWSGFSASTLAVVQLRNGLSGWSVPQFKDEAAQIYTSVGTALAAADEAALRQLTTRSCFTTMAQSLRSRPAGERHHWQALDVAASIKQVRIGHHRQTPARRFAQVTAAIDARLVWTITDRRGKRVGGVGSKEEPFTASDFWVFERCISEPAEAPAWRLKERLQPVAPT